MQTRTRIRIAWWQPLALLILLAALGLSAGSALAGQPATAPAAPVGADSTIGPDPDTIVPPQPPKAVEDAFNFLAPGQAGTCPAPPNGGTTQVGCTFVLDLFVNAGTNEPPNGATAQQSYLTFTYQLIQNARVSTIGAGCTITSTATQDNVVFDAVLQNEICNGPGTCVFRNITNQPGWFAYASGALNNCGEGCGGVFRTAQVGICATAPGTAVLHWQFSPPAPPTRDTEIVAFSGEIISNPALFTDYTFTIAGGVTSPTVTVTNTAGVPSVTTTPSSTNTAIPTGTNTAIPTGTNTTAPTNTVTRTSTSIPTNTSTIIPTNTSTTAPTNTSTSAPTNTGTAVATNTGTAAPTNTSTSVPTNSSTAVSTNTSTTAPTNTRTSVPTNTGTSVPTNTSTTAPSNTSTSVPTNTGTTAPSNTRTAVATNTGTSVPTNTSTSAPTNTSTTAPSNTSTSVPTNSSTAAPSSTRTSTTVATGTNTAVSTNTRTVLPSITATSGTGTPSATPCGTRADIQMVQWLTVQGNRVYATFHNTSQTCSVLVGVATYMRFNNNIEDQQLFDFEQYLLAPGETRQLSAALPPCAYQADAFVGPVIVSFRGGVRYGDRLIDDIVRNGNWCRAGTGTPVPATRTPGTQTPGATRTQTPSSCDNCRLQIRDVTIHCNSDGTIHWTATVRNQNNNCSTVADWSIELQVREDEDGHDNGHWIGVQTQEGTTTFAPGDNTVSGDFCYRFSHDVERTRAEFSIDSPSRCRADRTSQTIEPCEHPADCSRN